MATTAKNFVSLSAAALTGSGYSTGGVVLAMAAASARNHASSGLGTILDEWSANLATAGYAKNGCVLLTLSASTPVTIELTNLAALSVTAGDLVFAIWKEIQFKNLGPNPVAVGPGASNPLTTPLGGTNPTQTFVTGEETRWMRPAGVTVDATHKTLTFDPGALACVIGVCIGGA